MAALPRRGLGVASHLETAWNGSAWRFPILVLPTLVALWILRRKGAEWFAVPAVWPATQFYYVAMAMPALSRPAHRRRAARPARAVLMTPLVVIALAVHRGLAQTRRGRSSAQARCARRSSGG